MQICLWWPCWQRSYPASWRAASSHCADGLFLGAGEDIVEHVQDVAFCPSGREKVLKWDGWIKFIEWSVSFFLFVYHPLPPQELGLIRKPASFMTSICDERGQELIYAGMPITEVFKSEIGLGGTLGLLWFQRRLDFWVMWSPWSLWPEGSLAVIYMQVAKVRLSIHWNVPYGDCWSRSCGFWCPQHHCLCTSRQRSHL